MTPVRTSGTIPTGQAPDNFDDAPDIVAFGVPGGRVKFQFLHLRCFEREHHGHSRTLFTRTQAWDAIKAHGLSPACPVCGASVLETESPRTR